MNRAESACCTPLARVSNVRARPVQVRRSVSAVAQGSTTDCAVGDDA